AVRDARALSRRHGRLLELQRRVARTRPRGDAEPAPAAGAGVRHVPADQTLRGHGAARAPLRRPAGIVPAGHRASCGTAVRVSGHLRPLDETGVGPDRDAKRANRCQTSKSTVTCCTIVACGACITSTPSTTLEVTTVPSRVSTKAVPEPGASSVTITG